MKRFPKELLVKWEESTGTDEPFLTCSVDAEEVAEQGESVTVALYKLVGLRKLTNSTRIE